MGSVVSETIGANSGLGQMMLAAQAGFNVELVFAGVIALAIRGIALYAIRRWLNGVLRARHFERKVSADCDFALSLKLI